MKSSIQSVIVLKANDNVEIGINKWQRQSHYHRSFPFHCEMTSTQTKTRNRNGWLLCAVHTSDYQTNDVLFIIFKLEKVGRIVVILTINRKNLQPFFPTIQLMLVIFRCHLTNELCV